MQAWKNLSSPALWCLQLQNRAQAKTPGANGTQEQSTNIYVDPNRMDSNEVGEHLDDVYFHGYFRGLKTFYYCYSQAGVLSAKLIPSQPGPTEHFNEEVDGAACFLRPGDPGFTDCEACQ